MGKLGAAAALLLALSGCILFEKSSTYRFDGAVPSDAAGFSNALYQATGVKLVPGNAIEAVNNGDFFPRLADDLKRAVHSIDIVVFIWQPGEASDLLLPVILERARAGVECRIIADAMASNGFAERVQPDLESAGCQVRLARQGARIDRNHRKIFVIDGRLAYTGGVGIRSEWLGDGETKDKWRDSNVRIRGPVVEQLERAFAENWVEEAGSLVPASHFPTLAKQGESRAAFVASASTTNITAAERLTHLALAAAKRRAWITNAYFAPSPGLVELIKQKRQQGVEIRLMLPSNQTDHPEMVMMQRKHYQDLLADGVRIFEYQPAMLHAKTMVVDDAIAMVGSINLDWLSQDKLDEGNLVIFDEAFVEKLEAQFVYDQKRCSEMLP